MNKNLKAEEDGDFDTEANNRKRTTKVNTWLLSEGRDKGPGELGGS